MAKTGLYTKEIIEHFKHPKNVGKMTNADGLGRAGNLKCGDIMHLYIKIGRDKNGREVIREASFQTFGCVIAIANTSLLTTMIKGKTLKEAMKIGKEDLIKKFGQVPLSKIHCSLLAVDALSEAIYNYFLKKGRAISKELQERHEKIEREEKEIEHRHGILVELEKEMYEK